LAASQQGSSELGFAFDLLKFWINLAASQQSSSELGFAFDLLKFWINLAASQQSSSELGFAFDLLKFCFFLADFAIASWTIACYAPAKLSQNLHNNKSKSNSS